MKYPKWFVLLIGLSLTAMPGIAIAQSSPPSAKPAPQKTIIPLKPRTPSGALSVNSTSWKNPRLVFTLNALTETETKKIKEMREEGIPVSNGSTYPVSISPDGKTLASGGINAVRLWDLQTGKDATAPLAQTQGVSPFGIKSVAFSPDGQLLSVASGARQIFQQSGGNRSMQWRSEGIVEVWNLRSRNRLTWRDAVGLGAQAALSSSEQLIYAGSGLKVINISDGRSIFSLPAIGGTNQFFALLPSQNILVSPEFNGDIAFQDLKDGKSLGSISDKTLSGSSNSELTLNLDTCIATSPDETMLAISRDGKVITIVNVQNLRTQIEKQLEMNIQQIESKHQGKVTFMAFSPDHQVLATASEDKTVKLWDVKTGTPITTITEHGAAMTSVAFAPDGKMLVTSGMDGKVRVWRND
jgi:WD40 repeat protein